MATRSSFSRIRHPTGVSSTGASFLARTDFSHSIDPLEASKRAIGLLRVKGICLVSLRELFIALAVAVCENCTGGGRVIFSGTKSFKKSVLNARLVKTAEQKYQIICIHVFKSVKTSPPATLCSIRVRCCLRPELTRDFPALLNESCQKFGRLTTNQLSWRI